MGDGGRGKRDARRERPESTSTIEWVVAAVSAIAVLTLIGFLAWEALASRGTPPDVVVRADPVVELSTGYLVEFTVRNRGDETAAGLQLEGALERDGRSVETSSITIDYLPARGRHRGGLYFSRDPRLYDLRIRAVGYQNP